MEEEIKVDRLELTEEQKKIVVRIDTLRDQIEFLKSLLPISYVVKRENWK